MKYLVNSREMKQYDKNTIETFGISSMVLMERAALACVEQLGKLPVSLEHVLIVCGSGNNGGDGYAIARLLWQQGHKVTVVATGGRETVENRAQKKSYTAYGNQVLTRIPEGESYTLIIDAVFGVGLSRSVEGEYAALLTAMNDLSGTKVAIDVPSGVSSDTGAILGCAFCADYTITFAYTKIGTELWPGNEYSGTVITVDIGIDAHSFLERRPSVTALEETDLCNLPVRTGHSNKGTYGKVLVVAGSPGMSGAAYFSAKAAYATGAGLVRIYTAEENRIILQSQLPEAIITTCHGRKPEISVLNEAMKWADIIVAGPGIGTSDGAKSMVAAVLNNASVPVVLDADALNIIAEDTAVLLRPHTELIVTPHLGEMARLTGESVGYIQNHLKEVAEEFARQYNVICVLKDEHTITSVPYGMTYLNLSGNPGMATAGSGDVLSGIIASLSAQKMSAEMAAAYGVYLHGLAGDAAIDKTGMRGLMASDLIDGLQKVSLTQERFR